MQRTLTVQSKEVGQRLDIFVRQHFPSIPRTQLQRAIHAGDIQINNKEVKPKHVIKEGDKVQVHIQQHTPQQADTPLADIPILFEDKNVVVINKPPGIASHAGIGQETNTVAAWFTRTYPNIQVGEDKNRWGIVHRLDKDTSGVMILAKNEEAYTDLKRQFQNRYVKKEYIALVFTEPKDAQGRITRPLARSSRNPMRRTIDPEGKPAVTHWHVIERFSGRYTLLQVIPQTGRTHQIRAHLHFLGHPIVGDQLYTHKRQKTPRNVTRQMLHAYTLSLRLPDGNKTFTAPLPEDFSRVLDALRQTEEEKQGKSKSLGFRTPASFKTNKDRS